MGQAGFCSQPAGTSRSLHGVLWWWGWEGGDRAQDGRWAEDKPWPCSKQTRLGNWERASFLVSVPSLCHEKSENRVDGKAF